MGGSQYDTPFLLEKEPGNKFKIAEDVERSMNKHSDIPFLRTQVDAMKFNKTHTGGFGVSPNQTGRSFSTVKARQQNRNMKRLQRKEIGWNNYVKPISKYNTQVHPSMRIVFE